MTVEVRVRLLRYARSRSIHLHDLAIFENYGRRLGSQHRRLSDFRVKGALHVLTFCSLLWNRVIHKSGSRNFVIDCESAGSALLSWRIGNGYIWMLKKSLQPIREHIGIGDCTAVGMLVVARSRLLVS